MKTIDRFVDKTFPFFTLTAQLATLALLVTIFVVLNSIAAEDTAKSIQKVTEQHLALQREIEQIAQAAGLPIPTSDSSVFSPTPAVRTPVPSTPTPTPTLAPLPLPTPKVCVTIPLTTACIGVK